MSTSSIFAQAKTPTTTMLSVEGAKRKYRDELSIVLLWVSTIQKHEDFGAFPGRGFEPSGGGEGDIKATQSNLSQDWLKPA